MALPQATCTKYRAPDGTLVGGIPHDSSPAGYKPVVERYYAFSTFEPTELESWVDIAAFLWPLPLMAVAKRTRSNRMRWSIRILDLLLALGAGVWIWLEVTIFVSPAIGAYIALGALAIYFLASVIDFWGQWRQRNATPQSA